MDAISSLVALASVTVLLAVLTLRVFWTPRNINVPPGPRGFPVVGSLFNLFPNPAQTIGQWSKKYGSTVSVRFGPRLMVIMHDYDTVKSVFSQEITTGRDKDFILNIIFKGKGLAISEGELWHEHRRFALSTLRDLGMGKGWLESAVMEEVQELMNIFKSTSGTPCNPRPRLTLSVSNVVCALVFGKRFDHTDKKFQHLCTLFGENIGFLAKVAPVQFFPFLKYLPMFRKTWRLFFENIASLQAFASSLVIEHAIKESDLEDEVSAGVLKNDYVNSYLIEKSKQGLQKGDLSTFDDEQLLLSVLNLFAAGTETTTSTLLWSFVYMLENPDIKRKVQEEIDANVDRTRPVGLQDRGLLKYTEATILEIQRLASVVPLGIPHTNFEAMKIDGFDVPTRTLLSANVFDMHRNPRYWQHPDRMYPEHFIDRGGGIYLPKGFLPFGVGKRACLGESLAKMEIYLFFANIMQQFDLQESNKKVSSDNFVISLARSPLPYEICFVSRA